MATPVTMLLVVLLITLCQAECPIECFCDEVTVCSGDKQLTRFTPPASFQPATIIRLELHDYLVDHLDKGTFLALISNVTELRLTNNVHLATMDNNTFSLPSVDEEGKTMGRGAQEALTTTINAPADPSSSTLNLRTLDLSGNALKYFVGGKRLKRVRLLDLSSNQLQQVYQLDALTSLESVNLRDNQLELLHRTIFQNLGNLQYINLDSNRIVRLDPTTFSNLPSLAHLILSSNPIENLLPGFLWNARVQFVDVSHVGLLRIPTSLTTSVRDFRCANNNLTIIRQSDFESYPNVGLLVLDENGIETIEDDAFGRLDFLSRLWINGNRLTRIPQNLPPSLRSLQLEDNRISGLNWTDFKNLINLQELNLHGNQLAAVPPYIFSELTNLRSLDLRSNLIDTLGKDSFTGLLRLESLDVSQNPIRVIVNGLFKDLIKLSLLHMSQLEQRTIEFDTSSFTPLANLQVLQMDDSPSLAQTIFRDAGLSSFLSLIELHAERCNLADLHIVTAALNEPPLLDSLRLVRLGGNPWDCSYPNSTRTPEDFRAFAQLYHKQIIADANEMLCTRPRGQTVISVAMARGAGNLMSDGTEPDERTGRQEPSTSSLTSTPPPPDEQVEKSRVEGPPTGHTEDPLSERTLVSPSALTTRAPPKAAGNEGAVEGMRRTTATASKSADFLTSETVGGRRGESGSEVTVPAGSSASVLQLEITITEKPTRSYFEDQTPRPTRKTRTTPTTTTRGGTQPISNKDGGKSKKLSFPSPTSSSSPPSPSSSPPPPLPHTRPQWRGSSLPSSASRHEEKVEQENETAEQTNTKTNDDNAIIDEERNPRSFQHHRQPPESSYSERSGEDHDQEPTTPRAEPAGSIDGFPASGPHPHPITMVIPNASDKAQPNPSYLKSSIGQHGNGMSSDEDGGGKLEEGKTVILKTLVVLAVACLVSILFLLLLSVTLFRFSSWRFQTSSALPIISIGRRKMRMWDKTSCEECDSGSNNASCENLNGMRTTAAPGSARSTSYHGGIQPHPPMTTTATTHRGPTGRSYTRLGDQDTVELSGITNRLYFENEDIYHIT